MAAINQDDADDIVKAVINEADYTIEDMSDIPGGISIHVDLQQAERDADHVFVPEADIDHVHLSEEEGSTSYAMLAEMTDDEGRAVIFVGYHNMGEYSDDENDTNIGGTLYVVDEDSRAATLALARTKYETMISDEIVQKVRQAVELLEHAGGGVSAILRQSDDMRTLMRAMACG